MYLCFVWNSTGYMYKMDLALNTLQWLIYHKTKPNNYGKSLTYKKFFDIFPLERVENALSHAEGIRHPCKKVV